MNHVHRLSFTWGANLRRHGLAPLMAAALLPALAQQVAAQPSVVQQSGAGYNSDALEEIIVTASKRSEEISKVGEAVSAVSGEQLQELGANSLEDYLAFIPGVVLQSLGTPGYGIVSIRGVSPQSVGSTTATYIDEVPFGATSAFTQNALFTLDMNPTDLERVEVLKGPQGTLYGASSMGGLIKYVTRAPDLNQVEIRTSENFNESQNGSLGTKLSGAVSVPLIPGMLAVRLNAFYVHDGGYIDDIGVGGKDTNRGNDKGMHASVLYQPVDDLSIRLNAILQYTNVHGQNVVDYDPSGNHPLYGSNVQFRYLLEPFTNEMSLYSSEIKWHLNSVDFISATSYSALRPYSFGDATSLYEAIGLPYASAQTPIGGGASYPMHKETQEFRLTSERMGRWEWMLGVFYQNEVDEDNITEYQYQANGSANPPLSPLAPLEQSLRHGTLDEYAGFANATFYIAPQFDVTAGIRDSHIDETNYRAQSGLLYNAADPALTSSTYQTFSEHNATYMLGLRYRLTEDDLLYARAASGYRPGGYRPVPATAPAGFGDSYNSDSLWDYEGGVKTKWLSGRLTMDADVFWINWKDIQALQPIPGSIQVVSGNAGTAVSRGAEAALAYLVTKGLTVGANSAFTDVKFTESIPLVGVINGEPLFYVPRYTDTVYANYEHPLVDGWNGFVGGDYQYQSQRLDINRMPLPGFATWNMHLGVHDAKNRINLYINNLTNKQGLMGYGNGGYGAPYDFVVNTTRTIGITFSQSF